VEAADDTGKNTLAAARHYVSGEYDKVLANKNFILSGTRLTKARQAAQQLNARGQMADEAKEAGKIVSNILGPAELNKAPTKISSAEFTDLTNKLSSAAYESGSTEVKNRVLAARNVLIERVRNTKLTPDELDRIGVLDSKHFDVKRLEEATKGVRGEMEGVSIPALTNAYAKKNMPGNTTLEDLMAPAARILGPSHATNESRSQLVSAMRISAPLAGAGAAAATGVLLLRPAQGVGWGWSVRAPPPRSAYHPAPPQCISWGRSNQLKAWGQLQAGRGWLCRLLSLICRRQNVHPLYWSPQRLLTSAVLSQCSRIRTAKNPALSLINKRNDVSFEDLCPRAGTGAGAVEHL